METLTQMVIFMFFCMMVYIVHKVLIRVYTEAVRELERASFFKKRHPTPSFVSGFNKVLASATFLSGSPEGTSGEKCLPTFRSISTLNSLSQAQTPNCRRQVAPDDSEDSDDAYAAMPKTVIKLMQVGSRKAHLTLQSLLPRSSSSSYRFLREACLPLLGWL
jgi:hypothetical protein